MHLMESTVINTYQLKPVVIKTMLFIQILVKTLLIIKLCHSLTVYQPRKRKSSLIEHPTATICQIMPHQQASVSNTVGKITSLNFLQPGYSNIYPIQCLDNYKWTISNANEQPVIAASLESKALNEPKNFTVKNTQKPLSINYHNKIYHINTVNKASPLTNNKHDKDDAEFLVKKQRNANVYNDDKLIEQNIEGIKNANEQNDQQYTEAAASVSASPQQPSTKSSRPTARTSHETRYLHDIFLNYPKSHHVNFGHTELSPLLFEKRFESQKLGNRYRGEIMWLDNTGGFAQHYWDLAQGRR